MGVQQQIVSKGRQRHKRATLRYKEFTITKGQKNPNNFSFSPGKVGALDVVQCVSCWRFLRCSPGDPGPSVLQTHSRIKRDVQVFWGREDAALPSDGARAATPPPPSSPEGWTSAPVPRVTRVTCVTR